MVKKKVRGEKKNGEVKTKITQEGRKDLGVNRDFYGKTLG